MFKFFICTFFCLISIVKAEENKIIPDCKELFEKTIKENSPSCIKKCYSIKDPEPGTLRFAGCQSECKQFCENMEYKGRVLKEVSKFRENISDEDRDLISKYPMKSAEVLILARNAENMCATIYESNLTNDESDACRHFVWSALLFKNIGKDDAEIYLNAHEKVKGQPTKDMEMDLFNNKVGIEYAQKTTEILTDETILKAFQESLKTNKLRVLRPRKQPKGNP